MSIAVADILADRLRRREVTGHETRAERVARCRDIMQFALTYFPHYASKPFGPHHKAKFRIAQTEWRGLRLVDCEPRGHGKTTSNCPILVAYAHCYGLSKHTGLVGHSEDDSKDLLEGLKHEFLENELLIADHGPFLDVNAPKFAVNRLWQQRQIILLDGSRIRALSKGKQIRGKKHRQDRFDLLVLDDLQKKEDCHEREQRDKLTDWVLSDAEPAVKPDGAVIISGNIVHWDCVVARLLKGGSSWRTLRTQAIQSWPDREDLWEEYRAIIGDGAEEGHVARARAFYDDRRAAMDAGAKVLWPDGMPLESLIRAQARIGRVRFEVEFQNNARDEESHPWRVERIKRFDRNALKLGVRPAPLRAVMICDPAKQRGRHGAAGSRQAWAVIAQHAETGAVYVIDAWKGKKPDTGYVDEIFRAFLTWNAWLPARLPRVMMESNGAMLLAPIIHRLSLQDGVNLPITELAAVGEKTDRDSAAIDPLITYGALYIEDSLNWLVDDLCDFPDGDLDAIDCLAHGVNELRVPRTVEGYGSGRRRETVGVEVW